MHKICFTISFTSCLYMFRVNVLIIRRSKLHYTASGIITPIGGRLVPLHVSSKCAHHQEVKIALHSLWYHHTYILFLSFRIIVTPLPLGSIGLSSFEERLTTILRNVTESHTRTLKSPVTRLREPQNLPWEISWPDKSLTWFRKIGLLYTTEIFFWRFADRASQYIYLTI